MDTVGDMTKNETRMRKAARGQPVPATHKSAFDELAAQAEQMRKAARQSPLDDELDKLAAQAKQLAEQFARRFVASAAPKRYRSPALRSLHEAMEDLHAVGAIDKATMRDFAGGGRLLLVLSRPLFGRKCKAVSKLGLRRFPHLTLLGDHKQVGRSVCFEGDRR